MARSQRDLVIQQTYSQRFREYVQALGYDNEDELPDADFHNIANEVVVENLSTLHYGALVQEGLSVDVSVAPPDWTARAAAAGATYKDIAAVARAQHPDLPEHEALQKFQRSLARMSGSTVAEPRERMYGNPF